jgi:hypothetical protein
MRQTIACNIKCLAENILNPHIINPLPSIKRKADQMYKDFISSKKGKSIYDEATKKHPDLPCRVELILSSLRDEISAVANDDPNKFQLLNAYLRDKISEGLQ